MSMPLQLAQMQVPSPRKRRRRRRLADAITIVLLAGIFGALVIIAAPIVGATGCALVNFLTPIVAEWSVSQ